MVGMKGKNLATILVFIAFLIAGIAYITLTKKNNIPEYETPSPEKVVEQYFTAWSNKNYPDMYAAISDGFKKIEPTAKDLGAFKEYAESQGIDNARILSIKESSNETSNARTNGFIKIIMTPAIINA